MLTVSTDRTVHDGVDHIVGRLSKVDCSTHNQEDNQERGCQYRTTRTSSELFSTLAVPAPMLFQLLRRYQIGPKGCDTLDRSLTSRPQNDLVANMGSAGSITNK